MAKKLEWGKSKEGVCYSKCGRFVTFHPYGPTGASKYYALRDFDRGVNHHSFKTQREAKASAQRIINKGE